MHDKNLQVVEAFIIARSAEERLALYAEDAVFNLPFSHSLISRDSRWEGRSELEKLEAARSRLFPDWEFFNTKYHRTQNPSVIFVRTMGRGHYAPSGAPGRLLETYYYLQFTVDEGKITRLQQFQNPYAIANMLGVH